MEIDDLKKVWTKINSETGQPVYSSEEIANFRKARSKDFSTWIQNGLMLDIIMKGLFIVVFAVLIILYSGTPIFIVIASAIILLLIGLLIIESRYLKSSKDVDSKYITVQEGIQAKLDFLKTYYYKIQFLQGLSNPILVAAGVCIFYYQKYGAFRIDGSRDILVLIVLLLVSYLLTLPTTFSLYGYHYKILKGTLASLEDEEAWTETLKKYEIQKRILAWVLGSLLLIGIVGLVILLLF